MLISNNVEQKRNVAQIIFTQKNIKKLYNIITKTIHITTTNKKTNVRKKRQTIRNYEKTILIRW